jgi:hypothetical protein
METVCPEKVRKWTMGDAAIEERRGNEISRGDGRNIQLVHIGDRLCKCVDVGKSAGCGWSVLRVAEGS